MNLVSILFFGLFGVAARYFIGISSVQIFPRFPVGTMGINIVGSFLIGVIYIWSAERSYISPELRLGIMVGFLGGFTTFSSYSLDTLRLIEETRYFQAVLYWTLSPILGLLATFAGAGITRLILR